MGLLSSVRPLRRWSSPTSPTRSCEACASCPTTSTSMGWMFGGGKTFGQSSKVGLVTRPACSGPSRLPIPEHRAQPCHGIVSTGSETADCGRPVLRGGRRPRAPRDSLRLSGHGTVDDGAGRRCRAARRRARPGSGQKSSRPADRLRTRRDVRPDLVNDLSGDVRPNPRACRTQSPCRLTAQARID